MAPLAWEPGTRPAFANSQKVGIVVVPRQSTGIGDKPARGGKRLWPRTRAGRSSGRSTRCSRRGRSAGWPTGSCSSASRPGMVRPPSWRSRPSSSVTARWSCASAGACSATSTTPRMPSRPRSSSWPARRARSGGESRWRAGFTAWPTTWRPRPGRTRPGGARTSWRRGGQDRRPWPKRPGMTSARWSMRSSTGSQDATARPSSSVTWRA